MRHGVETCPDDHEVLRARLDELSLEGARIITVLWQPGRADLSDQSAALSASGNFLIIFDVDGQATLEVEDVLRRPVPPANEPRV